MTYEAFVRARLPVTVLSHRRATPMKSLYDSKSRGAIARVVLQIDGASSGKRKFLGRYFLPILSRNAEDLYLSCSRELSAREAANFATGFFISARYIFSQRSLAGRESHRGFEGVVLLDLYTCPKNWPSTIISHIVVTNIRTVNYIKFFLVYHVKSSSGCSVIIT